MNAVLGWGGAAALVGALVGSGGVAEAQAVTTDQSSALAAPAGDAFTDDDAADLEEHPMGRVGVGLKLGMAGMSRANLRIAQSEIGYTGKVDSRAGFHLALPIHLGSSGFGWMFEPYLSQSTILRAVRDDGGAVHDEDARLTALGMYTGPVIHIQLMQPLYLGVGLGLRAAYVAAQGFDAGADLYARLPISATYYLSNQVALVAELGLGYGASVFVTKEPRVHVDPLTGDSESDETPLFGTAFAWDCSIGVRLP